MTQDENVVKLIEQFKKHDKVVFVVTGCGETVHNTIDFEPAVSVLEEYLLLAKDDNSVVPVPAMIINTPVGINGITYPSGYKFYSCECGTGVWKNYRRCPICGKELKWNLVKD